MNYDYYYEDSKSEADEIIEEANQPVRFYFELKSEEVTSNDK